MLLIYTGSKKELKLTRPELEKKYHFKENKPVKVTEGDGKYLVKEFPTAFTEIEPEPEPMKKPEPDKKTKQGAGQKKVRIMDIN
ncbi:MAG: hypothetical protein HON48_14325 [Desulfobacula sp.]|jgi:hypothetical protein|nr:hypothetical protein [Desulfobacula sp.]